jgi:hypothetical protein
MTASRALGLAGALLLATVPAHGQDMPTFSARELLDAHNAARQQVGSPPLVWSTVLANHAKSWADELIASHVFARRPDDSHGENLLITSGRPVKPADAVLAWVAEKPDYDAETNTCTGVCAHYVQVVWRATRAVGCGMAFDGNRQVWVCEYDPPGNIAGTRPY